MQHRVHRELSAALSDLYRLATQRREVRHVFEDEALHVEALLRSIDAEVQRLIDELEAAERA